MKKFILIFNTIAVLFILFINVYSEDIFFYKAYKTDSKIIYDGNEIEFEAPVVTIDNHTYIPLREAAEKMDISVNWNGEENKIILTENSNDVYARELFNSLFKFALPSTAEVLNYDYYVENDEQYFAAKISFNQSDLEYITSKLSENYAYIDYLNQRNYINFISVYSNEYPWWELSELTDSDLNYRIMKSGVYKKTVEICFFITKASDGEYYLYVYQL